MQWIIGLAVIGGACILAGVTWLTASMIILVRSLEETEDNIPSISVASGRTLERMQTSWGHSAFADMAEWKAGRRESEPAQTEAERTVFRRLHRIGRALLAGGLLVSGGSLLMSLSAFYIPVLMKLLDPVFDGVINDSLGLIPVAEVGAAAGLAGGGLTWLGKQSPTRP